jgi:hypothetical protein
VPSDKPALLKESVSVKKSDEDAVFKGELELYDDHVVLKISHRFALSALMRSLPPTFPDVEMDEAIPFSRITGISWDMKKRGLSRNVKIEMQTDEGVIWHVNGSVIILDAFQNVYQTWKHRGQR